MQLDKIFTVRERVNAMQLTNFFSLDHRKCLENRNESYDEDTLYSSFHIQVNSDSVREIRLLACNRIHSTKCGKQ